MLEKKHLKVCEQLRNLEGVSVYLVGGFVRDALLGRKAKDVDVVVVGAKPNAVIRLPGCKLIGSSFPVYQLDGVEIALARTERKRGRGYLRFDWSTSNVTLEEDLQRRDLSINAIAMDPFSGEIIDPLNGQKDLSDRILRPAGSAFGEDPLRVLRAARFAAQLSMELSDELVEAVKPVLSELDTLCGERVWGELAKALRSEQPSRFFHALDKMGALESVFPEIAALKDRIQPESYHPEGDAYVHTLEVIDRARDLGADDETMFAALVHDLGKAVTPDDELPHHYNHESLGVPLVREMGRRLRVPNSHLKAGMVTAKEHLNIHRFDDLRATKKVRLLMRLGVVQNDLLARRVVMASKADAQGRGPKFRDALYLQGDNVLRAAKVICEVRGHDFAHLKDGNKIAQRIEQARAKALKQNGFK